MSLAKLLLVSSVFLGVGGACGAVPDDGTDGPTDGAMDAKPPPPPQLTWTVTSNLTMTVAE